MQPFRTQAHRLNINDFSLVTGTLPSVVVVVNSSADYGCLEEGYCIYRKIFLCVSSRPWASKEAPSAISLSACLSCPFCIFLNLLLYLGRPSLQGPKLMSCSGAIVARCSCNCGSMGTAPCHITITVIKQ